MRVAVWVLLFSLLLVPAVRADDGQEAVQRLSDYLRLDTTNPPGHERRGAEYLQGLLRQEGIESTLYETAPDRAVLYARLHGNGSGRPMLLLNHIDVVPAVASEWQVPPFSGLVKDGYIWGRGAIDMKSIGIMQLEAFIELKRQNVPLARDVIFMSVADEEAGGEMGTHWMLTHHADLFTGLQYVLDEGSRGISENGKPRYWEVVGGEKAPLWLRVTAKGRGGHGSRPAFDDPTHRLSRALGRLAAWRPPVRVLPSIEKFFGAIAPYQVGPRAVWFKDIRRALKTDATAEADLDTTPDLAALVRDTVAITVLRGSDKTNVIPSEASVELDCRLLPGTNPDVFLKTLKGVLGDNRLQIEALMRTTAYASPEDSLAMRTIRKYLETPGVPVVMPIARGASDSRFFRERGVAAYGFAPYMMDDSLWAGVHGIDERLSIESLERGVQLMEHVVHDLATTPG